MSSYRVREGPTSTCAVSSSEGGETREPCRECQRLCRSLGPGCACGLGEARGGRHRRRLVLRPATDPFLCLQRKPGTPDTSFLTSGPRNCANTSFSFFQPPRVWVLLTTAVGAAPSACRVPCSLGGLHQPVDGPTNSPSQRLCTPSRSVTLTRGHALSLTPLQSSQLRNSQVRPHPLPAPARTVFLGASARQACRNV